MKKIQEVYPKNKGLFMKLIPFTKEILLICKKNKIKPIIYGSFAHFYHTKDKKMKVNDIDLYIPENSFEKIIKTLKQKKINYKYLPKWHTLIIKKGKLKVEIDSVNFWYKKSLKKVDRINFYGIESKIITLSDLEKLYPIAYNQTNDNKRKILKKIKHLERFLGRKLK